MKSAILSNLELGNICRSLAVLLHAGVSTADSMFLLAQEESGQKKELFTEMGQQLDQGGTLSDILQKTNMFPKHVSGMVRIGERTGRVEETLEALAEFYEECHRVSKFLRSALAYPALILILVLAVVAVLLIEVLPVFDSVYASLGSRLTGLAAGLLHFGQGLKRALPVLWGLLAAVVMGVVLISWVPRLKKCVQSGFQRALGDCGAMRKFQNARFARALAMGLGSGLPVDEALTLASDLLSDVPGAASRSRICVQLLEAGKSLPEAMEETGLLTASASRMLAVGIRGGNGDQVMRGIADRMQEEAADAVERIVSRIEPAMVLLTSALVGMVLLSVMLPLMNIMSSIG